MAALQVMQLCNVKQNKRYRSVQKHCAISRLCLQIKYTCINARTFTLPLLPKTAALISFFLSFVWQD